MFDLINGKLLIVRYLYILVLLCILSESGKAQELTVLSYNIRYDNPADGKDRWALRKKELADQLSNLSPAVISSQEGLFHQLEYLDSQLDHYKYIGVGREDGKRAGEFSAIFYDTTICAVSHTGTFWLSDTPTQTSRGWDAALERICTYGLFELLETGKQFWVFNTHFDHAGPEARTRSAELLVKVIDSLNTQKQPVILTGDLNCMPDSKPYEILTDHMQDPVYLENIVLDGPAGTYNGFDPKVRADRRIDYIFTKGIPVDSYQHLDDRRKSGRYISDHFPVLLRTGIPEK